MTSLDDAHPLVRNCIYIMTVTLSPAVRRRVERWNIRPKTDDYDSSPSYMENTEFMVESARLIIIIRWNL